MQRDQLPPHRSATFVLDRWKIVYVSVPKAACTSLKWLVADLQGEDPERFYRSRSREVGRSMCVHMRSLWRKTPTLHAMTDSGLAGVSPDQGWFVFTVVRHPSARLWSGWQSKFLLREPRYLEKFGDTEWFPRVPRSTEDVVEDFGRFVRSIADDPEQPVMRDRHVRRQTELIAHGRTPYSQIYHTSDIPLLLKDLESHLHAQGWDGELALESSNETPLRPAASAFGPEVAQRILELYAPDFAGLGYSDVLPHGLEHGDYSDGALAEIGRLIERAERIGDLGLTAQQLQADNANLRARLAEQRERVAEQRARVAQLRGQRSAPLRRIRRRIMKIRPDRGTA